MKFLTVMVALFLLSGCEPADVAEGSIWSICDKYQDICDVTHSGALCSIPRNDTIRALAKQRITPNSIVTYEALKVLDDYKGCLEDAFVSEAVRNKDDKQSQMTTIRQIPEIQREIMATTRNKARPEINLWLWQRSQKDSYLESMKNGIELVKEVHRDVYVALMMQTAQKDLEEAKVFARKAMSKSQQIADIEPRIYEFYIGYYLATEDFHKAAVWQGLYSALDADNAKVNEEYFGVYQKMDSRQIEKAQQEVESLLFDEKWLNKTMDAFPKSLI